MRQSNVISFHDWCDTHSVVPPKANHFRADRSRGVTREDMYHDWFDFLMQAVVTPVYPPK